MGFPFCIFFLFLFFFCWYTCFLLLLKLNVDNGLFKAWKLTACLEEGPLNYPAVVVGCMYKKIWRYALWSLRTYHHHSKFPYHTLIISSTQEAKAKSEKIASFLCRTHEPWIKMKRWILCIRPLFYLSNIICTLEVRIENAWT